MSNYTHLRNFGVEIHLNPLFGTHEKHRFTYSRRIHRDKMCLRITQIFKLGVLLRRSSTLTSKSVVTPESLIIHPSIPSYTCVSWSEFQGSLESIEGHTKHKIEQWSTVSYHTTPYLKQNNWKDKSFSEKQLKQGNDWKELSAKWPNGNAGVGSHCPRCPGNLAVYIVIE